MDDGSVIRSGHPTTILTQEGSCSQNFEVGRLLETAVKGEGSQAARSGPQAPNQVIGEVSLAGPVVGKGLPEQVLVLKPELPGTE